MRTRVGSGFAGDTTANGLQVENLRYSRLQICATADNLDNGGMRPYASRVSVEGLRNCEAVGGDAGLNKDGVPVRIGQALNAPVNQENVTCALVHRLDPA